MSQYGRHFKEKKPEPPVEDRTVPSCKKCRHLMIQNRKCCCDLGRVLEPCEAFSDASRQVDRFANLNIGRR